MAWCYILRCNDGTWYVGWTDDLQQRLDAHARGRASYYTSKRLPVSLAYVEPLNSADAARARERQIKRWTRVKKDALIAGDRTTLASWSRRHPA